MRMTNLRLTAFAIPIIFCFFCTFTKAYGQNTESTLSEHFEVRYKVWLDAMSKNPHLSASSAYPEWGEMVKLGRPIVPFIFEKLQENRHNAIRAGLRDALQVLTWKSFRNSKWPEGQFGNPNIETEMLIDWWHNKRANTEQVFTEVYTEWLNVNEKSDVKTVEIAWGRIRDMGIDIFPIVVDKINSGETRLIPLIPQIMRKEVIKENASVEDVKKWWHENETKLYIPSTKEEAEEIFQKLQQAKSDKETAKVPSNTPSPESESDMSRQMPANWILPTVIAGTIVLVGVAVFLLLRMRKTERR